jgi:two-component system response regulator ResD
VKATSARSVLIVDDEPTIAEVVARYLERAGYRTQVATDGPQAIIETANWRPDLVVLDIMMPGIDGLRVMRRLQDLSPSHLGIILLTARGEESDRVVGLRMGADDYIVKPFSPAELVARVDAVLRRLDRPDDTRGPRLDLGEIVIDPPTRQVFAHQREVTLTAREFDLLLFLARHPLQVFSRDQIMDHVWQYAFYSDTSTVTVHMRRLRAKLESDPARPRHLETVWGVGYRFVP